MSEFKHVLFSERDQIANLHPALKALNPGFIEPYLSGATEYPDDFPYLFYAMEEGIVASRINSFFDTLFMNERQYAWGWNANLFTDPRFRGRGLAEQIIEYQLAEFSKRGLVWGGTFSSEPALRLYRKLGFQVVGSASRMCLLCRPASFLAHHLGSGLAVAGLSRAYAIAYRSAGTFLFRQRSFRKEFRTDEIDVGELASLLNDYPIRHGGRAHWNDNTALLREKIEARKTDRICIVRDCSSRPIFFFVWRVRETSERPIKEKYRGVRMFSVMEYGLLSDLEAWDVLIEAAIALYHQADADLLEIISSPPGLERAARKHGLMSLGTGMSFTFKAPSGHPLENLESKVADWHLTHFSGDGYSFE